MNVNKKLQEIQKEIDELNDKILKIRKGEIKTGFGIERDSALLDFLESRLKDVLIEYNDEFDKTYSKGFIIRDLDDFLAFLVVVLAILGIMLLAKCDSKENQSNISAYEEEQKQIYEAKIKGVL